MLLVGIYFDNKSNAALEIDRGSWALPFIFIIDKLSAKYKYIFYRRRSHENKNIRRVYRSRHSLEL